MHTVKDVLIRAKEYEQSGQFDKAIKFYQAVVDRMPNTKYAKYAQNCIDQLNISIDLDLDEDIEDTDKSKKINNNDKEKDNDKGSDLVEKPKKKKQSTTITSKWWFWVIFILIIFAVFAFLYVKNPPKKTNTSSSYSESEYDDSEDELDDDEDTEIVDPSDGLMYAYNDYCNGEYWAELSEDNTELRIYVNGSSLEEKFNTVLEINKFLGFSDSVGDEMGETTELDGDRTLNNNYFQVEWFYYSGTLVVTYTYIG
ncbi:tol-pal system YbgF family protein [uncultured Pseudoramibacter sp.]|uniref:tetratricopeptide repeat protein n=1 Tax=uncultured Pseudoramibacter sp. TaxID=1623493 RepID=UPI0025D0CFE3|nr:hypothetical protein [uncultured Pseudoramibacter sp.]